MANEQNLVKGDEAHTLTAEEASRGGKRSAEVRREKRDLRKALEIGTSSGEATLSQDDVLLESQLMEK